MRNISTKMRQNATHTHTQKKHSSRENERKYTHSNTSFPTQSIIYLSNNELFTCLEHGCCGGVYSILFRLYLVSDFRANPTRVTQILDRKRHL